MIINNTITSTLLSSQVKDLERALASDKEYLLFRIWVFNVGAIIKIICTDRFINVGGKNWNGYDFIVENDDTMKHYIKQTLKEKKDGEN